MEGAGCCGGVRRLCWLHNKLSLMFKRNVAQLRDVDVVEARIATRKRRRCDVAPSSHPFAHVTTEHSMMATPNAKGSNALPLRQWLLHRLRRRLLHWLRRSSPARCWLWWCKNCLSTCLHLLTSAP